MAIKKNEYDCCVYVAEKESCVVTKTTCPTYCEDSTEVKSETTLAGCGSTHEPEFFLPTDAEEVLCGRKLGYYGSGNTIKDECLETPISDTLASLEVGEDGSITITEADGDKRTVIDSSKIMTNSEYQDLSGNTI